MSSGTNPVDSNGSPVGPMVIKPKESPPKVEPIKVVKNGVTGRMVSKKVYLPPLGAEAWVISFEKDPDSPK